MLSNDALCSLVGPGLICKAHVELLQQALLSHASPHCAPGGKRCTASSPTSGH